MTVPRMMAQMRHRGPDDEGLFVDGSVALGMRRLSIIDLSGGHQPVFNEDGTVAVVFNGEIYNFRELQHTLKSRGHAFRTQSDTEVIVHAYEEWGSDCVDHLEGMFAFALADAAKSSLPTSSRVLLARDRLGIKPLYYALANGNLFFASEVRSLLASGHIERRLSQPALHCYLLFGSVVEPMTLVDGVYSLLPGHRMVISEGSPPTVRTESYWDFTKTAEKKTEGAPMNRRLAAASVRALLEKTVESHLIADVPVGVFLSSGIDSTTLAALAAQRTASLHTVTVVFQEQEFNEAELARRTAQRLGTQHQELPLSGADMLERLGEAVDAFDQPSMDGINSYFVSWAARQAGLKVALSGLGGDELFGGYSTFQATPRAKSVAALARRVPASLRSLSAAAFEKVCGNSNRKDAHRKIAALWRDPNHLPHPYFYTRLLFTPEQVSSLLSPNAAKPSIAGGTRASATSSNGAGAVEPWQEWLERIARESEHLDGFAAVSCLESRSYLVNTLLRDTDSMSMAHSLEVRVPFLDHTLVEFVAQLPRAIKSGNGVPKSLLVEAMGNLLPADVVSQRKRTFTLPWEHWLRGPLKGQVESELTALAPPLATHLDSRAITKVWTSFLQGNTSWSRVWSLFVLSKWARRHLGCTSDDQPVTADSQQEAAVRIT